MKINIYKYSGKTSSVWILQTLLNAKGAADTGCRVGRGKKSRGTNILPTCVFASKIFVLLLLLFPEKSEEFPDVERNNSSQNMFPLFFGIFCFFKCYPCLSITFYGFRTNPPDSDGYFLCTVNFVDVVLKTQFYRVIN